MMATLNNRTRQLRRLLVVFTLLSPRLYVIFRTHLWVEDESYLTCGLLMARGAVPYLDFHLQHFPLLEGFLALIFRVFGPSLGAVELVTQASLVVSTWLVYDIGRRLDGPLVGLVSAALFSVSPLLLRYHLFGREIFVIFFLLAATRLVLCTDLPRPYLVHVTIGMLCALALLSKMTAIGAAVTIPAWVTATSSPWRRGLWCFTGLGALAGSITLTLSLLFGIPFLVQAFLFGFAHPSFGSFAGKLQLYGRDFMTVYIAAALVSVVMLTIEGRARQWGLVIVLAVVSLVFGPVLKPVIWSHNAIEVLPWACLLCGWLLLEIGKWLASLLKSLRSPPYHLRAVSRLALTSIGMLGVVSLWPAHIEPLNRWIDRDSLNSMATFLAQNTPPGAVVVAPAIISFAADRRDVVPYLEIDGAMTDLERTVAAEGWRGALAKSKHRRSMRMAPAVDESIHQSMPAVLNAIRTGRVAAVHNCERTVGWSSGVELLPRPLVIGGYQQAKVWEQCVTWLPVK